MATNKGPQDIRAELEAVMSSGIGDLFIAISGDLQNLHFEWRWFNELYDAGDESLELMNKTAGSFFGHMQHVQMGSLVLRIFRLIDKPTGTRRKRPNASIELLLQRIRDCGFIEFYKEHIKSLSKARSLAENISSHRSRKFGHSDLAVATGTEKLQPLVKSEFEEVLALLTGIANSVSFKFQQKSTTLYERGNEDGGPKQLLFWLAQGLDHKECRLREIRKKIEDSE